MVPILNHVEYWELLLASAFAGLGLLAIYKRSSTSETITKPSIPVARDTDTSLKSEAKLSGGLQRYEPGGTCTKLTRCYEHLFAREAESSFY